MKMRTEMTQDSGIQAIRAKQDRAAQRTCSSAFSSAVKILNLIEGEVRTVMGGILLGKNQDRTLFAGRASILVLVLSLAFCLTFAVNADAVTSGPNNPSTGANNSSIGSRSWSSTSNVVSSNDSYASVSLSRNQISNYLTATGFGFVIPSGSTINGITVTVERRERNNTSSVSIRDNSVKIIKAGTVTGTEHANTGSNWPTSDQSATYGSTTDLWGQTWTPADINASNFGVAISAIGYASQSTSNSEEARIDNVRITVTYTAAAACTAVAPTVTITPASQTITTNGGSAPYTVTIRNNDTGTGCSNVSYTLTPSDTNTTAFNASTLSSASVSLAAGATSSPITLTVSAKSGQTSGTNTTTVTASATGHANGSSSVTTTLNVPTTCTANTPTLQIAPVSRTVAPGGTATYTITVINNDTSVCSATTYSLSVVSDSNSANFNTPSTLNAINLSLNPGQSGTSALAVSAKATAANNSANITTVSVTATGHTSPANVTASTTVSIATPGASLLHNSTTTNSSKWASEGGWGVAGGKYGEFVCSTCHTEDTTNIKRVKQQITVPDTSKGNIPGSTVNFQSTSGLNSFGDDTGGHATSTKVCEVCHSQTSVHKYNQPTYIGHESPAASDCTACHKHNKGFKPAGGCTICHSMPQGNRAIIVGQFSANSHHIQGVTLTDQHCYQCHWEGNSDGSINTTYHGGAAAPGAPVNLVIYGAGSRPSTYGVGTTAVEYTANGQRVELQKINNHCLGCHSSQNNTTQPFGDGKTPKQYAWDGTSVAERYSQAGTTPWGKYSGLNVTPKNTQTKAYSAHGNAAANQRGWNLTETWPNTSGTVNVLCFDCHNSHGSTVAGKTTSYPNPATTNGAILKDTTTGKGGYAVTYKPAAGGSAADKNPYNPGAAICFDCHMTASGGTTKPWGYSGTFGGTQAIVGYWEKPYWFGAAGVNPSGSQQRYVYKNKIGSQGGHLSASSPLGTAVMGTIGGLCTPCHDPHGVSPTLGANQQYSVPLLKGTWLTSPYKEDAAPLATNESRGGGREQNPFRGASTPGYKIDQNTFNTLPTTPPYTWNFSSTAQVSQTDDQFGGLCLQCHAKTALNPSSAAGWKTVQRIHSTVKGWGNNTMHKFTCSKCHTPHNSCLPRLAITNCLDSKHRGRVGQGGTVRTGTNLYTGQQSGSDGSGRGRFPAGGGGYGEEPTDWGNNRGGAYFFGIAGTSKNSYPAFRACHDNIGTGTWPDVEYWNSVTPWLAP